MRETNNRQEEEEKSRKLVREKHDTRVERRTKRGIGAKEKDKNKEERRK